jgi:hypothetical protein
VRCRPSLFTSLVDSVFSCCLPKHFIGHETGKSPTGSTFVEGTPGLVAYRILVTVADLDHAETVSPKHLEEAMQYGSLDWNYWS